ncbi:MAG: hypothetical protein HOG96_09790, partial [Porticoccaceae bacterium]|nr:hypothetical protein [Porticoccaceae bacterium]
MTDAIDNPATKAPVGPYESLRDYIDAIDGCGQALHISGLDQDAYEATGFMYRLIDKLGWADAPAVIFKNIKINGQWHEGPVIANQYGRWQFEGLAFGVDPANDEQSEVYQNVLAKLESLATTDKQWQEIEPIEVSPEDAPCKQVVVL